jgi:hypothetical protein
MRKNSINIFLNVDYDVHYHPRESQIKIQPMYGETKMTSCIKEVS